MQVWHAIILGVIEGITEFLPISSTGHLTIAEKMLGYSISDSSITAFTAIIQSGAVLATVVYFWKDISRVLMAWMRGLFVNKYRKNSDYKYGWAIIIGSIPIAIIGILFKDEIETVLRSLWFVAIALILWSLVMWWADKKAKQNLHEEDITWRDTLAVGIAQCLALIPGVSRSGATMSAGLLRNFDRVAVTKLSFFLSIPALSAAGILQIISKHSAIGASVGWTATIIATLISFVVAYISVAWLLKFVAKHDYSVFIWYRVIVGVLLLIALATNFISAN
ncbi:undecaprenyl-diphosphate phosphatase [Candidatus Saccharibacteria bacterium]|jgi:undecaprenyl-diphosphatase uppP|nr:undecaprenyl-diphosphate phosphatase [Candidatus Saccharibacteria bacterium]UJD06744.1 MAG: undecaprenyl-diphosphate phosphatase [Candidatus Nanosynbacter sp. HMT-348_TM7c-JB]